MKQIQILFAGLAICTAAFAQRPTNPALLIPQRAPELDYVAVPNGLKLPGGITMGAPAAVAFDSKGHMIIATRAPQRLLEFDAGGNFIRSFAEGVFTRTHGLRIDGDGNFWVADVGAHLVVKLSPAGEVLLALGTKGEAGAWDETAGSHRLDQPNDLAFGRGGDVFVVQGHTPGSGDPRVLKFDRNGRFVKSWGGRGTEPGKFNVAHGIAVDAKGLLWVADRENQRIQIFDQDGEFVKELKYAGLPCSIAIGRDSIFMVNGFAAQLLELDLNGAVLAALGKPGKGVGEFGEAHSVTASPQGDVYVADTVNSTLQKFVRK
jgi:sugar lactone lactonase YvrE